MSQKLEIWNLDKKKRTQNPESGFSDVSFNTPQENCKQESWGAFGASKLKMRNSSHTGTFPLYFFIFCVSLVVRFVK